MNDAPHVIAVCASTRHEFSKSPQIAIRLVEGLGIESDAHAGTTVQHIYDKRRDPTRPNLRQVHLIHAELLDELATGGFAVRPGDLGENVSTRGVDLLNLPRGTLLRIGSGAAPACKSTVSSRAFSPRCESGSRANSSAARA